jgi:hypothetical protein
MYVHSACTPLRAPLSLLPSTLAHAPSASTNSALHPQLPCAQVMKDHFLRAEDLPSDFDFAKYLRSCMSFHVTRALHISNSSWMTAICILVLNMARSAIDHVVSGEPPETWDVRSMWLYFALSYVLFATTVVMLVVGRRAKDLAMAKIGCETAHALAEALEAIRSHPIAKSFATGSKMVSGGTYVHVTLRNDDGAGGGAIPTSALPADDGLPKAAGSGAGGAGGYGAVKGVANNKKDNKAAAAAAKKEKAKLKGTAGDPLLSIASGKSGADEDSDEESGGKAKGAGGGAQGGADKNFGAELVSGIFPWDSPWLYQKAMEVLSLLQCLYMALAVLVNIAAVAQQFSHGTAAAYLIFLFGPQFIVGFALFPRITKNLIFIEACGHVDRRIVGSVLVNMQAIHSLKTYGPPRALYPVRLVSRVC